MPRRLHFRLDFEFTSVSLRLHFGFTSTEKTDLDDTFFRRSCAFDPRLKPNSAETSYKMALYASTSIVTGITPKADLGVKGGLRINTSHAPH